MAAARAIFWIGVYWALVVAPLALLCLDPLPPGAGFWTDLSAALGYIALSMMGVQFLLTARFRRASAPFGIDLLYYFHRYVAVFAFALALAHAAILPAANPGLWGFWRNSGVPRHIHAALGAVLLFGAVLAASLWRKEMRVPYGRWRYWHGPLAVGAVLLAVGHARSAGSYLVIPWKRHAWTALMLLWPLLLAYVRIAKPWRRARKPYRVAGVRKETDDAWTLTLEPVGHAGLRFVPGQFAWLTVGPSPYSLEEHPFSISSAPDALGRAEFTIKALGDFTRTVKNIPMGETAYLDGPYGAFTADQYKSAPGLVFIAGGVGIAPAMSMLRTMAARRETRPLLLFYGNKDWQSVIFRDDLAKLEAQLNLRVIYILRNPPADWNGETGVLTQEILGRCLPEGRFELEYFICGPVPMIRAAERGLSSLGVTLRRIHAELFDLV